MGVEVRTDSVTLWSNSEKWVANVAKKTFKMHFDNSRQNTQTMIGEQPAITCASFPSDLQKLSVAALKYRPLGPFEDFAPACRPQVWQMNYPRQPNSFPCQYKPLETRLVWNLCLIYGIHVSSMGYCKILSNYIDFFNQYAHWSTNKPMIRDVNAATVPPAPEAHRKSFAAEHQPPRNLNGASGASAIADSGRYPKIQADFTEVKDVKDLYKS